LSWYQKRSVGADVVRALEKRTGNHEKIHRFGGGFCRRSD
jgi:hypothetical protein